MIIDLRLKKSNDKKIESFYNKAIKDLDTFYQIKWNENKPNVFLIKSRKDFDILYGYKTEPWVVGTTMGTQNEVYLLAPDVYEKQSNHKYSDREYEALLRHEISHLYSRIFFSEYRPRWLLEGIAIYSSGQLELKRKIIKFSAFLDFFDKGGSGIYEESGWAVLILDKEFGREKLLELLKSLNGFKNKEEFLKIFKKIYGFDLKYKWFNERIEKYI